VTEQPQSGGSGAQPIELKLAPAQPCHRCGTPLLLRATNAQGRVIVVCKRCDADDPYAGPIVCYVTVHGTVQPDGLEDFAGLLRTWAEHAEPAKVDPEQLEAEYQAWLRGDL
jgi:hypothetical protein